MQAENSFLSKAVSVACWQFSQEGSSRELLAAGSDNSQELSALT